VTTKNKAEQPANRRLIKKYPNRRLYDTDTSSYVTLSQVKDLVVNGDAILVRDAKTEADITRSILLQIILEEEAGGQPMFTEAALANIIRFYGNTMQSFMGPFIERNVQSFTEMQRNFSAQSGGITPDIWMTMLKGNTPAAKGLMANYVEQTQDLLQQMQENFAKQTGDMFGAFNRKK
jgi:polyhydroxyalkanoate synthesis repressor PhaR